MTRASISAVEKRPSFSCGRGKSGIDIGVQPVSTLTKRELRRFVPGQRERREACARARSQLLWLQAGEALAQTLVFYPQTADYLSITPRVGIARHVQTVALHRLLCDVA